MTIEASFLFHANDVLRIKSPIDQQFPVLIQKTEKQLFFVIPENAIRKTQIHTEKQNLGMPLQHAAQQLPVAVKIIDVIWIRFPVSWC